MRSWTNCRKCSNKSSRWNEAEPRMSPPVTSLYVHVPFCVHKCQYCAFYSEIATPESVERYVRALTREMELVRPDCVPQTVYFGGGTPTLLTPQQWEQLFQAMDRLDMLGAAEWTVECNPATLTSDKARLLRDHGVNRISLGLQSLDDELLGRLGRVHSRAMAFQAYDRLRKAGFANVNLDLMFAIPGQTMAMWDATLTEALAMESEHLSSYEVTYEEDTPLFEQLQARQFSVDENLACDMYEQLVRRAETAGLQQYEVSNFARTGEDRGSRDAGVKSPPNRIPGLACRHNVNYWRGGPFYGLGPSASSFVHGMRTKNWSNTARYCERLENGQRPIESTDELSPLGRAGELAAFGLRLTAGWPFEEFRQTTGFDLRQEWAVEIQMLIEKGLGQTDADGLRLTARGLRLADWVAEQFLRS